MYKYIGLIILYCIANTPARAIAAWTESNCSNKGGIIRTIGDKTFCSSTNTMNWWSAYSWCQAIGGRMPSIWELCPEVGITQGGNCGRTYTGWAWSSTPNGQNGYMWFVNGNTLKNDQTRTLSTHVSAYCLSQ